MISKRILYLAILIPCILVGLRIGAGILIPIGRAAGIVGIGADLIIGYAVAGVGLACVPGFAIFLARMENSTQISQVANRLMAWYVSLLFLGSLGIGVWAAAAVRAGYSKLVEWYRPPALLWGVITTLCIMAMLVTAGWAFVLILQIWNKNESRVNGGREN